RHDSMGVADGVGGWNAMPRANPALFSRKIMHYAAMELEKYDDTLSDDFSFEGYYDTDPKDILGKSYVQLMRDAERENFMGSTTALIVVLRDNELRVTNLGDCGLMIIRDGETIFRTEEQQHSFNCPFQLGTGCSVLPTDAQSYTIKIQEGDIVLIGSDGLFDNVFDEEMVGIVASVTSRITFTLANGVNPRVIADALIARALEVAEDRRCLSSPFASRAIKEGLYYQGGKMDDVTILAGVIQVAEDSPDRR
ncbi:hypothetical protein CXG81DRAFT_15295, partial [Caulochytrium protostelioides]